MNFRVLTAVGLAGIFACSRYGKDDVGVELGAEPAAVPPEHEADTALPGDAPPKLEDTPPEDEITEAFGVFVANGAKGGDGTRARPFDTISDAIKHVRASKKRVYVCSGQYRESVTIESGVSMVGTLSCSEGTWRLGAARARIISPATPALRARDIGLATRFEGFEVVAPDGSSDAPSSIVLIADRAPKLTVTNSKLVAGKGAHGADGARGLPLTLAPDASGENGLPTQGPVLAKSGVPFHDRFERRPGGRGGVGRCIGAPGHDGEAGGAGGFGATHLCTPPQIIAVPGRPAPPNVWRIHSGGMPSVPYSRSNGEPRSGAEGESGTHGASAMATGALGTEGYAVASGLRGENGKPGKGGAGGDGAESVDGTQCTPAMSGYYTASGAGGGAGGCPGLAGTPGIGGGASIGVLLIASPELAFTNVEIIAADGGNGGKGAFGSPPTTGGSGGLAGIAGAPGGAGGRAGASGSGAGGPSYAVAYTAGAPAIASDVATTHGKGGAGVPELANGQHEKIAPSAEGPTKAIYAF